VNDILNSPTFLEVRGISKWFGGIHALDNVSLNLKQGEVVGVVGDNGAGKSTLLKIIAGVHPPSAGEIVIAGEPVHFESPKHARDAGIETVYQDLALVEEFDVPTNFFLGRELIYHPWFPVMRRNQMRQMAHETVRNLQINIPKSNMRVAQMSGGQRQGVAIGRAVFWQGKLLLLDEPTAALGVQESAEVKRLLRHLVRERQLAMMIISHNMVEVFEVCDTIVVLRQGRQVATLAKAETTPEKVVGLITGANIARA
jgi:ABC-type sugar transport system ATPase subunit